MRVHEWGSFPIGITPPVGIILFVRPSTAPTKIFIGGLLRNHCYFRLITLQWYFYCNVQAVSDGPFIFMFLIQVVCHNKQRFFIHLKQIGLLKTHETFYLQGFSALEISSRNLRIFPALLGLFQNSMYFLILIAWGYGLWEHRDRLR